MSADKQYYGVAWNYENDTYVLTGSLLHATPENIDELMFVHNSFEKSVEIRADGGYAVSKIYERRSYVGTSFITEISLLPLRGFSLCKESDVVHVLLMVERGIWKSLECPDTMRFNSIGDAEREMGTVYGTPIQKPLKQVIDGIYELPSVYKQEYIPIVAQPKTGCVHARVSSNVLGSRRCETMSHKTKGETKW